MTADEIRAAIQCLPYPDEDAYSVGVILADGKYIGFACLPDERQVCKLEVLAVALEYQLAKVERQNLELRLKVNRQTPVVTWACKYRDELTGEREDKYLGRLIEEVDLYEQKVFIVAEAAKAAG